MSPTAAAEASILNDVDFLEKLERFEHMDEHGRDLTPDQPAFDAAFDALDTGLPVSQAARRLEVPPHEQAPIGEPRERPVRQPAAAETHIPFTAAALVLAACLTAGAATAAFAFHGRVSQITSQRPATR